MSREYVFGSGQLFTLPTAGGQPTKFGTLQNVDVEFTGDIKELHGQYGFAVAAGRGKQKVSIKAGNGDFDINLYNTTYFSGPIGAGVSTGSYQQALDEAGTPSGGPPPIVTVANSARFYLDLGVFDTVTGLYMEPVASVSAATEYSVAAGVYTFNTAFSHPVLINYLYTATGGLTMPMNNQLIGTEPHFQLILAETYQGNWFVMKFNNVMCHKLTTPLKQDDFGINDLEFSAQVDSTGSLGFISTSSSY
jgi:hypothetical protein